MSYSFKKRGFTLIEVLLVVVIIAILAGIVIIAVNPARQIAQTNNAQRDSDVRSILDAVHQYAVDNRGALPAAITGEALMIGDASIDICTDLVPTYLAEMPFDPTYATGAYTDCTTYDSGYTIMEGADGRVTVAAPTAELSEIISVTR
ncbi:MAG: type II secretion system protein [Candidatus Gracilibacteria bacterium]